MNNNYKRTALVLMTMFLSMATANTFAQKSIYDVIPGSGPKNRKAPTTKRTGTSLPDIIKGKDSRREDDRVYDERREHLPPGQAKKIYGGRATDYAPGQMKKHHKKHHHSKKWKNDNEGDHDNKGNGKHEKNDD
jgi:hypothetical protein